MTNEQLNEIAGQLEFGFLCFIHKKTKALVVIPDELSHPDMDTESWEKEIKEIDKNRKSYFEVEKMDSRESFKVMEDFVDTVDDDRIQDKLRESLQRPKPFQNFRFDIDRSVPYREKWFEFKKNRNIEWVKGQIESARR